MSVIKNPDSNQLSNWEDAILEAIANLAPISESETMYSASKEEIPFQLKKLYFHLRDKRYQLLNIKSTEE